MSGMTQFELHAAGFDLHSGENGAEPDPFGPISYSDSPDVSDPPFPLREEEGTVWARLNGESGLLERSDGPAGSDYALRVLKQRLSSRLALLTRRGDVLVNGLPALTLTLLATKDSVRLAPGRLFYVTERVKPYVGQATEEMVGKKCPFCRLPITAETHVVTCRCGAVYHHETVETRPDLPEEDRLICIDKVQACLACGQQLTLEEYLVWDPMTLGPE